MLKTLFFTILALASYKVEAAVTARWLTVASVALDDGKTRILFDPAWTRPGLLHWLNLKKFISDEALVNSILRNNDLLKTDAVFASHSHFDHVVDAPMVSKLTGAVFYTDENSERLALAYNDPKIRTIKFQSSQQIRVGDFVITPLPRVHAKIMDMFYFLPGPVPKNVTLSFWDYYTGDTWFYLVEHPEVTVIVDQGSVANLEVIRPFVNSVDVVIQGVANRKDDKGILDGYIHHLSPGQFIPVHFDNFFFDFNDGAESSLPGANLENFLAQIKKARPGLKVDRPLYGKKINLLKIQR